MARYTFTCEHFNYNDFNGDEQDVASKHTTQFRADTLETMLENFELFLRGAGFHFDGVVDIVRPESGDFAEGMDTESIIDELDRQIQDYEQDEKNRRVFSHLMTDILKNPISFEPESDYKVNLDNMNSNFVVGSNDWDSEPSLMVDENVDLSSISEQFSFEFDNCDLCKLPKSVMTVNKCFDENCPIGS